MVCTQHLCLCRCPWPIKNVSRQRLCGKVCGTHRRRSKAPVCNISTAAHDRSKEISLIGLSDVLKREHKAAERCHICLKELNDPQNKKVRDHYRYTGWYRRAAHNNCNLKYRIPDHILIVFHNLSGYDVHLFIKELGKRFNNKDIGDIGEIQGEIGEIHRRNTSVLMLKLTSSWQGWEIKTAKKCLKMFRWDL